MELENPVFLGIDWSTKRHDVCLLGHTGVVLEERAFPNSPDGIFVLIQWLRLKCGDLKICRVATETAHEPIIETLMEHGLQVFVINPKQLDRFRDRFTTSGAKDDRRDARVQADSLRTDPRAFHKLEPRARSPADLRDLAGQEVGMAKANGRCP